MPILSVDLAFGRWSDIGIAILDQAPPPAPKASEPDRADLRSIHCELIAWDGSDLDASIPKSPVHPEILAGRLNHLCNVRNIRVIMLDGPQAWKSSSNGFAHARVSERHLNTACKTGLPGMVKPVTYRAFAEFCLDVYDALARRGWRRLDTSARPGPDPQRILVESYPCAAWKCLGLKPLPSKRRSRVSDLASAFAALQSVVPLTVSRPPNHDQLQAIVGGLPGLALDANGPDRPSGISARIIGAPPRREDGHWREGFIVLPDRTAS